MLQSLPANPVVGVKTPLGVFILHIPRNGARNLCYREDISLFHVQSVEAIKLATAEDVLKWVEELDLCIKLACYSKDKGPNIRFIVQSCKINPKDLMPVVTWEGYVSDANERVLKFILENKYENCDTI